MLNKLIAEILDLRVEKKVPDGQRIRLSIWSNVPAVKAIVEVNERLIRDETNAALLYDYNYDMPYRRIVDLNGHEAIIGIIQHLDYETF